MQDLFKNFFNQSPHPCVCYRAVMDDNGKPVDFEYEISNPSYDGLFGPPGKTSLKHSASPGKEDFDLFSFFTSLWRGESEICSEQYFPHVNKVMQLSSYKVDENLVVTCFYSLDRQSGFEKTLQEARHSSILLESMPGIAVQGYGPDRVVHFWNKASEELYGYKAEEAIGRDILELIIPGEIRLQVTANIDEMIRTGIGDNGDFLYLRHKDGTLKPVLSHHAVVEYPDGNKQLYCIDVDMAPHEKVEEDIRKLSRAVEQSPVSIVITDTEGNIEYVNPVFRDLTGYEKDEVIGENPRILKSGLVSPGDYDVMWQTIKSGQIWRGELINKKKSGEIYFELATIAPIFAAIQQLVFFDSQVKLDKIWAIDTQSRYNHIIRGRRLPQCIFL